MIIEHVIQNPGQMEQNTSDYKGYTKRTVIFLNDWVTAQFFEVDGKVIDNWKEGDTYTSEQGKLYASMNVSLVPRKFINIYHNDDINFSKIRTVVNPTDEKFGSSASSGIIEFNPDSGEYESK